MTKCVLMAVRSTSSATTWFPQHHARDVYISLLSHEPSVPPYLLSAALLRRAMTDVSRVMYIRDSKQSLSVLLQKSLIGDAFWNELLEAEKELEAEIKEVVEEAATFSPEWGRYIFAQASDMLQHERFKDTVKSLPTPLPKVQLRAGPVPPGAAQGQPLPPQLQQQLQQQQLQQQQGPPMTEEEKQNLMKERMAEYKAKMTPEQFAQLKSLADLHKAKMAAREQQSGAAPQGTSAPPAAAAAAAAGATKAGDGQDSSEGEDEPKGTPSGSASSTPSKSKVRLFSCLQRCLHH